MDHTPSRGYSHLGWGKNLEPCHSNHTSLSNIDFHAEYERHLLVLITCNNLVKFSGYSLTFGELVTKGTHYNCVHFFAKKNVQVPKVLCLA